MTLNAAISRPRREISDLSVLLRVCSIGTAEEAEAHFVDFYGEDLNEKAVTAVMVALESDDPRTNSAAPNPWA